MSRPLAVAGLLAVLLASGCTAGGDDGAGGGTSPAQSAGWAVLEEATSLYFELGEIRTELERECMRERGFDVHPPAGPHTGKDWQPIDRRAPRLAPTVDEAREWGFSPVAPLPVDGTVEPGDLGASEDGASTAPNPEDLEFYREDTDYQTAYWDEYIGYGTTPYKTGDPMAEKGTCAYTVYEHMYGEPIGEDQTDPLPVPVAFDREAQWAMYFAVPEVVPANAAWRECMDGRGHEYTDPHQAETKGYGKNHDEQVELAVDVAECVDASGMRTVHEASWATAVDLVVAEEQGAIETWRDQLEEIRDSLR